MTPLLVILAAAMPAAAPSLAGPAPAAPPLATPPRPPADAPSIEALIERDTAPAIFTYRVDRRCRVSDTRKLQGGDRVRWQDADRARRVFAETTVFRFVQGHRTQLRERRVKLLGELVETGELVCHVRPSGEVVDAWIERHDTSAARRQSTRREAVPLRRGGIADIGTYSLTFLPDATGP